MLFALSFTAHAYNVVDLPEEMTLSDAMGVFGTDEIARITVSDTADEKSIELTSSEISSFYETAQNLTVHRMVNPTPFRGISINVYTESDVKCYYLNSGIQIGMYGSSNYICYKLSDADTEKLLYLDSTYKDAEEKSNDYTLYRNTANDFLKLPSAPWAQSFAREAAANSLLPYEFTGKYSESITREDFCKLLGNFIAVKGNYASLDLYMEDRGEPYLKNYFADCDGVDDSVNILYALGIVNGKDGVNFDPYGKITREEAATLLCKVSELYRPMGNVSELSYTDRNSVSQWALPYVKWADTNGVMSGVTDTEFSPQGAYTVEQAVATMVRLNNLLS